MYTIFIRCKLGCFKIDSEECFQIENRNFKHELVAQGLLFGMNYFVDAVNDAMKYPLGTFFVGKVVTSGKAVCILETKDVVMMIFHDKFVSNSERRIEVKLNNIYEMTHSARELANELSKR